MTVKEEEPGAARLPRRTGRSHYRKLGDDFDNAAVLPYLRRTPPEAARSPEAIGDTKTTRESPLQAGDRKTPQKTGRLTACGHSKLSEGRAGLRTVGETLQPETSGKDVKAFIRMRLFSSPDEMDAALTAAMPTCRKAAPGERAGNHPAGKGVQRQVLARRPAHPRD